MGSLISCHIIVSDLQAIKTVEGENRRGRERGGVVGAGQSWGVGLDRRAEGLHQEGRLFIKEVGRTFSREPQVLLPVVHF